MRRNESMKQRDLLSETESRQAVATVQVDGGKLANQYTDQLKSFIEGKPVQKPTKGKGKVDMGMMRGLFQSLKKFSSDG